MGGDHCFITVARYTRVTLSNQSHPRVPGACFSLDVSSGKTRSTWRIHRSNHPQCIVLASNRCGTFITASANSTVSFWDTTTHKSIVSVIEHAQEIRSIAIPQKTTTLRWAEATLRGLCDILPSPYFHDVPACKTLITLSTSQIHPQVGKLAYQG